MQGVHLVRPRSVADRLAKVINLIGGPILGVKKRKVKQEVQPVVIQTQVADAFSAINRGHFDL